MPICGVCSVEYGAKDTREVRITDFQKWIRSPCPCPECADRGLDAAAEAGRRMREAIERDTIERLQEKAGPITVDRKVE